MRQADDTPIAKKPATHNSKAERAAAPDWERIELDYRAGIKSLRQIASEHDITEGAVRKRAKRDDWTRDLSERIQAKAEQLVRTEAVRSEVRAAKEATERQVVAANAQGVADVLLSQRKDIQRAKGIVMRLLDELEHQAGIENAALLDELGDLMRGSSDDDRAADKLNDLYRKIISLPERARTAKTLTDSLRTTVDLQRQAFGMDAKGTTPDGGSGTTPRIPIEFVRPPQRREDDE